MSLLKPIEENSPHPLGETVGHKAASEGIGIYDASNRIGIENTASADIPAFLKPSVTKAEAAKRQLDAANAEQDAAISEYRRYEHLKDKASHDRIDVASCRTLIERAKADAPGLQQAIHDWTSKPLGELFARINSVLIAERLLIELPKWLAKAEGDLAKLEREVAELAKKFK